MAGSTNNAALYGVGKGNAQIINNSGALNNLAQQIARQQQQRQMELKMLAEQQAQLKPDGLRNDADRRDFFNQVNSWRNQSVAAQNERDPYKKAQMKAQADQAYMQAQDLVGKSKKRGDIESQFDLKFLDNNFRDQFADDAVDKVIKSKQIGVNDPSLLDFNSLNREVDHTKTLDIFKKVDKDLLNETTWGTPILTRQKIGNQNATFTQNQRVVNDEQRAKAYTNVIRASRDAKKMLYDVYGHMFNDDSLTPDEKEKAMVSQFIKDSGPVHEFKDPVQTLDRKAPEPSWEQQWYLDHYGVPYKPEEKKTTPADARNAFIGDIINRNKPALGTLEKVATSLGGKYEVKDNGIAITLPHIETRNKIEKQMINGKEQDVEVGKIQVKSNKRFFIYNNTKDNQASRTAINMLLNETGKELFDTRPVYDNKENPYKTQTTAPKPSVQPKGDKTFVTMQLPDGTTGQIPQAQLGAFIKKYPKAKRL